jgi:hypothetical protein
MNKGAKENPRHILGLSGGKDSTALAIHIKNTRPDVFEKLECYFTDTGEELEETYAYLDKIEQYLGKPIFRIQLDKSLEEGYRVITNHDDYSPFQDLLRRYKGYLPAPNARYCTREMKIVPMEKWIGQDHCVSYVGIRADEPSREGYTSRGKNKNITAIYPFKEDGLVISDIYKILDVSIGIPEYYKWRTRSGCYFCFYQRRVEWAILYHLYPHWFERSKAYETEHEDGRTYTWVKDKPLLYVAENSIDIITRYIKKQYKKASDTYKQGFKLTLEQMLELVEQGRIKEFVDTWDLKRLHDVDGNENTDGCLICAL